MTPRARFELIHALRAAPRATIDGINYGHVVGPLLWDGTARGHLKRVVYALLFGARLSTSGNGCQTVVFYSARSKGRQDYDHIAAVLRGSAGPESRYVESTDRLSLWQFIRTLRQIPAGLGAVRRLEATLSDRFAIALLISKFVSLLPDLSKTLLTPLGWGPLATFCDALPFENLAAQYARRNGLRTITAQHGPYRILDDSNLSPDAEAYTNFVSHQMLSWGGATVDEFAKVGIDDSRFVTVGWIREWPRIAAKTRPDGFGVILNGENGKSANRALIEVAEQLADRLKVPYVVRLHPANDVREYEQWVGMRCVEIRRFATAEYFEAVRFSVAHMSGAVIEALHFESPVYLLDEGTLAGVFKLEGLAFDGADALIEAVSRDQLDPEGCVAQTRGFSHLFNDDSDQADLLRSVLRAEVPDA